MYLGQEEFLTDSFSLFAAGEAPQITTTLDVPDLSIHFPEQHTFLLPVDQISDAVQPGTGIMSVLEVGAKQIGNILVPIAAAGAAVAKILTQPLPPRTATFPSWPPPMGPSPVEIQWPIQAQAVGTWLKQNPVMGAAGIALLALAAGLVLMPSSSRGRSRR